MDKEKKERIKHEIGFVLFLGFLSLGWYLGRNFPFDILALEGVLAGMSLFIACLFYVILYVAVTFFIFFSKDVFWFAGAFIFGPVLSTVLICISEVINACILFFLARKFGRGFVKKRLSAKYEKLDEKIGKISFFWLFIFRAAPLIPYRFLDLAAGLTKINFRRYILAVILGSPVKMFWIQYVIYGVGVNIFSDPAALTGYFINNKSLFIVSLVYLAMVFMVIFKLSRRK